MFLGVELNTVITMNNIEFSFDEINNKKKLFSKTNNNGNQNVLIEIDEISIMRKNFLKNLQIINSSKKKKKINPSIERKKEYYARKKLLESAEKLKKFGREVYVITIDRRGKVYGNMSDKFKEDFTPNSISLYNTTMNIVNEKKKSGHIIENTLLNTKIVNSNVNMQIICANKLFNYMENQTPNDVHLPNDKMDIDN